MRKISLKTKINEKRGTGTCADYKPYIYVSESKSDGTASIITDWKHGRAIQCLSQSEAMAYYVLRWDDSNVDIREQYPLSSVVTNDIRKVLFLPVLDKLSLNQRCSPEEMAAMKAYLTEKGIGLDDIKSCLEYYPHYVKDRIFEVFSK